MTIKWQLHDLSGALADYIFEINPSEMASPLRTKTLTIHGQTIDGQIRAAGLIAPHEWTFGGVLHSQAQHDALRDWVAGAGLTHLTDHLGRTFVVRLKLFNPTRAWTKQFPWRHKYVVNVTTYGGPV